MRIGVILEKKSGFQFEPNEPTDHDSELFSAEEEDALVSGLRDAGHEVIEIGDGKSLVNRIGFWRSRCDLVFNLSVGYRGLDRKSFVPGVLELAGIPYVGSAPYALSLTRHKYHAKIIVKDAGIDTPQATLWKNAEDDASLSRINYPAIVKPVAESSSIGLDKVDSIVDGPEQAARRASWLVATLKQPAIVETFIAGSEMEVPMIGWPKLEALGAAAISIGGAPVRGRDFLSSDLVYSNDYDFLTEVPWVDCNLIMQLAVRAATVLGIRDYGRIDFRVAGDGTPYFIEASTHPHIQPHSSFFAFAQKAGKSYPEMLEGIMAASLGRVHAQSSQNSISQ